MTLMVDGGEAEKHKGSNSFASFFLISSSPYISWVFVYIDKYSHSSLHTHTHSSHYFFRCLWVKGTETQERK
jgi:hypothetical protein